MTANGVFVFDWCFTGNSLMRLWYVTFTLFWFVLEQFFTYI